MTTELHNDRIINGLLKAGLGLRTPGDLAARLGTDVLLVAPPERAKEDLWPAVWCLASILERQFTGKVFVKAGLKEYPSAPIALGDRCIPVPDSFNYAGLTVALGVAPKDSHWICGDTRGPAIAHGELLMNGSDAHPIGCFALAGYLGFAALARAAGIPSFHERWAHPTLTLPIRLSASSVSGQFAVLGLGQIGQAFIALLFFLAHGRPLRVHLVDKGAFEDANRRTQLLVGGPPTDWLDAAKVEYVAGLCRGWGWNVTREQTTVGWQWRSPLGPGGVGFLGFDDMDARRMGVEGGFSRLIECGVGTDFLKPHVSWHSLPPSRTMARTFFYEDDEQSSVPDTDFIRTLAATPGGCGKVVFEGIQATAPCLGAVAVAFAAMELGNPQAESGETAVAGGAYLWSPLLPVDRQIHSLEHADR